MPDSPLILRRQVLDAIDACSDTELPKQQRDGLIQTIREANQATAVGGVLVRELRQAAETERLMAIAELFVELTTLETVQNDLWGVIEDPSTSDAVKDAANLALRNLGDTTEPDMYLEYLDDPDALIAEETGRMLALANENPSALVDFLDFTVSLPMEEQIRLLDSLRMDYPPGQLFPLYNALYWYEVSDQTMAFLKDQLATMPHAEAIPILTAMADTTTDDEFSQQLQRHCQKQRLKGAATDTKVHPLAEQGKLTHCYITLPDGIGNQGVMAIRTLANGDHCLLAAAINDQVGLLDAFGFYRLSDTDVAQLVAKFHEANLKIDASPDLMAALLHRAWWTSAKLGKPIPYEYTCWAGLVADVMPPIDSVGDPSSTWLADCQPWVNEARTGLTSELYLHPDFFTWFLEAEDAPFIGELLILAGKRVTPLMDEEDPPDSQVMQAQLEDDANNSMATLLTKPDGSEQTWQQLMVARLALSALLFNQAGNHTFASLAATEAHQLGRWQAGNDLTPFIQSFGRRCVLEYLLRLAKQHPPLDGFVQTLAQRWEPDLQIDGLIAELANLPDDVETGEIDAE